MADPASASRTGTLATVGAVLLVVLAIAIAATTGDSLAVRLILLVVSFDVAVRLWTWGKRSGR